jgi:hypothetical protein
MPLGTSKRRITPNELKEMYKPRKIKEGLNWNLNPGIV